jgi:enamine deaminase RidA (YjgF/YER057c/UK114 family)
VYLSGHVALDASGQLVGRGDPQAQAESIFEGIASTLAGAGASLQDIVHLRCYAVSSEAYSAYAEAKSRYFPGGPPAGTAVIVAALLDPAFLLEVEAIAWLRPKD